MARTGSLIPSGKSRRQRDTDCHRFRPQRAAGTRWSEKRRRQPLVDRVEGLVGAVEIRNPDPLRWWRYRCSGRTLGLCGRRLPELLGKKTACGFFPEDHILVRFGGRLKTYPP